MPTKRVLILFAHPALEKSVANRHLFKIARELPGITAVDLYQEYPDFNISVRNQQTLLLQNDVILFQHPFYWYSAPSLIKEWCDLVLELGFAYGEGGIALMGKAWVHAITTGAPESAYQSRGKNQFPVEEFLRPFSQSAKLCGMNFLKPFIVYESRKLNKEALRVAGLSYIEFIRQLQNESITQGSL